MNLELLIPAIILAPGAVYGLIRLPGMWTARADRPTPSPRRRLSFHDAWQEAYARGRGVRAVGVHRVRSMRAARCPGRAVQRSQVRRATGQPRRARSAPAVVAQPPSRA